MRSHFTPRSGNAIGLFVLSILFSLAFSLPRAGAATLVFEWGGNYVSSLTPFSVSPTYPAPGQTYYPYSSTAPIGTAGGKLYGAFLLEEAGTTPAFSTFGYTGSALNAIAFGTTAGPNESTMRGLFYFTREDFLVSGSGPITFDSESSFSYSVSSSGGASTGGSQRLTRALVYALVDGEWNWYVSPARNTGTAVATLTSLDSMEWAPYTFSADTPLAVAPTGTELILGSAFEDVGAIGVYFNYRRAAGTGSRNMSFYVNGLSLTATVIPEPSTLFLTGLGLAAFGLGWCRRRRGAAVRS